MKRNIFLSFLLFITFLSNAQKPESYSSADIQLMLDKLNVLGTVLYVAAHPDDENTRLITYMANEKKLYTGYFSFTRGDGGQNLIGAEIRDQLGVIRTQELLAARRIDGGVQFFSRAKDFGYSKHPDETFNIWDREKVLGDLVWVIRKFRPDVIINRFNVKPGETHGHHTASAMLSKEAFRLAADPQSYPEQLKYVSVWQPNAIYWNTYWWRSSEGLNLEEMVKYDIGAYNYLLGQSYSEIAALSRSQHKSQGFGVSGSRGKTIEYLKFIDGKRAKNDAFENIDISWGRVAGGKAIAAEVEAIRKNFNPRKPYEIVPSLTSLRNKVEKLDNDFWKQRKLEEIDELVYACLGLYLETTADDFSAAHGDSVYLSFEAINRSPYPAKLISVDVKQLDIERPLNSALKYNEKLDSTVGVVVPAHLPLSHPYWLKQEGTLGMFTVENQQMIGKAQNGNAFDVEFTLEINGEKIRYSKPVVFKRNDPVKGEVYRSFVIVPPVSVNIEGSVWMFPDDRSKKVKVSVRAGKDSVAGKVWLELPEGWSAAPEFFDYNLAVKGQEQIFEFFILPPKKPSNVIARAIAEYEGKWYEKSFVNIDYEHIPNQVLFPGATSNFVRVELERKGENIGYIMGAGDAVPEALRQIGYRVEILNGKPITPDYLEKFDAVILGVRAYNTEESLKFDTPVLHEYVKAGGTLIVQYNTSHRLITENIAPYPLKLSRNRVTVEEAKVKFIDEDHPVLNYPNKITEADFEGWVQERGLYFPEEWGEQYQTVISMHDPGEGPLKSGILTAKYGEGYFIYSSLSWFRELPAGVPGAYRLFTNLISIGE